MLHLKKKKNASVLKCVFHDRKERYEKEPLKVTDNTTADMTTGSKAMGHTENNRKY